MIGVQSENVSVQSASRTIIKGISRKPLALAALTFLGLEILVCLGANVFAPYNPLSQDLSAIQQLPSLSHLLGTDSVGRDVLSRILFGGRVTLEGAFEAVVVALALGVPLGIATGYIGGRFDRMMGRWVVDVMLSLPTIIVLLPVLVLFNQSMSAAMITFGVLSSISVLRVVRSATLAVTKELYISAAHVCGLSDIRIMVKHIFPRAIGPIVVQATILSAASLIVQAGLSFLGFGTPPPAPSWGGMINSAQSVLIGDPWLMVPPGLAVALTAIALGLLGDAVNDTVRDHWAGGRKPRGKSESVPSKGDAGIPRHPGAGIVMQVSGLCVEKQVSGRTVEVVSDVSFELRSGEILGVVGESGCGKSVTLSAIAGILPRGLFVTSGRLWIGGETFDLTRTDQLEKLRGKYFGMVFQEPVPSLDPAFKVGNQMVEVIRSLKKVSKGEAKKIALELFRSVSLAEGEVIFGKYPHELSGGMAQRVAIAKALAGDPLVIFADEPTTALDVSVQAEILELLRLLNTSQGVGIVLVTHDWGVVSDMCPRALVLYAGEVVEVGQVADLWSAPRHPYTVDLVAANPYFARPGERLRAIRGAVPEPGERPDHCRYADRCRKVTDDCRIRPIDLRTSEEGADGDVRCIYPEAGREVSVGSQVDR